MPENETELTELEVAILVHLTINGKADYLEIARVFRITSANIVTAISHLRSLGAIRHTTGSRYDLVPS